jgi:hypothetical protein
MSLSHTIRTLHSRSITFALVLACATFTAGCGDSVTKPDVVMRELGVVLTSTDISLTIFDVDDPTTTRTVGLGPDGSPVSMATRGELAAVPLGIVPAVAVVDLVDASLLRTIALPAGSGATGAAFVNDSIVLVANPGLGTVSPVNVLSGQALAEIPVGAYPQGVVAVDGLAYVVNANLVNFTPAGPASLTVIDGTTLQVVDEITLSGENAAAAALGPNGLLYVIQSGSWGMGNGSLSVVNPSSRSEVSHATGFGDFPGSVAADAQSRVYVGAFGIGMMVWDALTSSFVHGPTGAIEPGGIASTSGIGHDSAGRTYALSPDCQDPAQAHRLAADYTVELSIPVGICPFAIAFTEVEGVS